jgi:hypothetical protein
MLFISRPSRTQRLREANVDRFASLRSLWSRVRTSQSPRGPKPFPQIGRSVDIGGRSLNMYCSGEGQRCTPRRLHITAHDPSCTNTGWYAQLRFSAQRQTGRQYQGSGGSSSPASFSLGRACANFGRFIWFINSWISSGRIGTPASTPISSATHSTNTRSLYTSDTASSLVADKSHRELPVKRRQ